MGEQRIPGTLFKGIINRQTFVPSVMNLAISLALFIPLIIAAIPGFPLFAYIIFALWSLASLGGTIAALVNPSARFVRVDGRGIEFRTRFRHVTAPWMGITVITAPTVDLSGSAKFIGLPVADGMVKYPMIRVKYIDGQDERSFTIHGGNFENYPGILAAIQKRKEILPEAPEDGR